MNNNKYKPCDEVFPRLSYHESTDDVFLLSKRLSKVSENNYFSWKEFCQTYFEVPYLAREDYGRRYRRLKEKMERFNYDTLVEEEKIKDYIHDYDLLRYTVDQKIIDPLDLTDWYGNSLLTLAVRYGLKQQVKYLAKFSELLTRANLEGVTPLHEAAIQGNRCCAKILIKRGVDVNLKNHFGATPLFYAIYQEDLKMVKYLVRQGANINCPDNIGLRPIHVASFHNVFPEICRFLVQQGVEIQVRTRTGKSVLDLARINSNYVVEYLSSVLSEY